MSNWAERLRAEQDLVELATKYHDLIGEAWERCHEAQFPDAILCLRWSRSIDLVTSQEEVIWRRAMALRNAILACEFRIVLDDIIAHTERLRPIVDDLPARIERLGLGVS
jgi:hypothetical protein